MSREAWERRIGRRSIVVPKVAANKDFVATISRDQGVEETETEIIIGPGGSSVHTFAFIEPIESALEADRGAQKGLLLPLDLDASEHADSGYTGWVEYERGKFLAANYINDDAPLAQIRGYRFGLEDF